MAANTRYAVSAGHTEGEWEIVEYNDGESLTIHALNSDWRICFMATPGSSPNAISRIEANARLIVAACNSYDRHCTDPVSAAEGDLLGRCVEALRARIEALRSGTIEDEAQVDERIRTILSQVREVRG